jgi:hypothetical protein
MQGKWHRSEQSELGRNLSLLTTIVVVKVENS